MTTDARVGYSPLIIAAINAADPTNPVVKFAKMCIEEDVPVTSVSQTFGVTRTTVYNWFKGVYYPKGRHMQLMLEYLERGRLTTA